VAPGLGQLLGIATRTIYRKLETELPEEPEEGAPGV
jgi:hypothetical protein